MGVIPDKKEVVQRVVMQQIVVHHHIQQVAAPVAPPPKKEPKKEYSEEEDDGIDDETFYARKIEQLAAKLKIHHLEKINGLKVFINKLWERNQGLPVIIKSSSKEIFWKKH